MATAAPRPRCFPSSKTWPEKVQQAEAAATEAKAELKASEEVLATKNKTIDRLQRSLKRMEQLLADEQLAGIKKEAIDLQSETIGLVRGGLRQALIKLERRARRRQQSGLHGAWWALSMWEPGCAAGRVWPVPGRRRYHPGVGAVGNAQGTNAGAGAGTAAN